MPLLLEKLVSLSNDQNNNSSCLFSSLLAPNSHLLIDQGISQFFEEFQIFIYGLNLKEKEKRGQTPHKDRLIE